MDALILKIALSDYYTHFMLTERPQKKSGTLSESVVNEFRNQNSSPTSLSSDTWVFLYVLTFLTSGGWASMHVVLGTRSACS